MKLVRRIENIEVKRCFLISDYAKKYPLKDAKRLVCAMSEKELNKLIKRTTAKRLHAYNTLTWHIGKVKPTEIGLWRGAAGLPLSFTKGSVKDTARIIRPFLKNTSVFEKRAGIAIPGIMKNKIILAQKEKYLFPIVVPGGSYRRRGMKKMKGDLDDGCMRSLVLTLMGKKQIDAYIGAV